MGTKLRTVQQMATEFPAFTEPALRSIIFHAANNGLNASGALIRIGRRVYFDAERFETWLDGHRTNKHQ